MPSNPPLPSQSALFWRRTALAPVCLLLVAALQVYRVYACDQSAWKGGGFGMFSTVDSPAARFVRIYLETDDGRIPIAPPTALAKITSELRTAPSQARADELAKLLANDVYVPQQAAESRVTSLVGFAAVQPTRDRLVIAGVGERKRLSAKLVKPRGAVVQVWHYDYDRHAKALVAKLKYQSVVTTGATP